MTAQDGESAGVRQERSDVRRNRKALVRAGRELLISHPDIALYEVARRAGVGQATLYRHFPDRAALAGAVAEEIFAEIEVRVGEIDHSGPDALFDVVERVCSAAVTAGNLYALFQSDPADHTDVDRLRERLSGMLATPLLDAKKAGKVRRDVDVDDMLLIVRMVTSTIRATVEEPLVEAQLEACRRALRLVWAGVAPTQAAA